MKRFSYVAEYCPTDLSIKLTSPPAVSNTGNSRSVNKRKPLCCINRCPNQINEQLNMKLCYEVDFVATGDGTEVNKDWEDDEITINPPRRKRYRSLIVEMDVMFTSTTIRYTTSIPRNRLNESKGFCITPVKRSTRHRNLSTPGYLDDQKSCYNSPSEVSSDAVMILPNKYLCNSDKV